MDVVLIDFAHTLMHPEPAERWLAVSLTSAGVDIPLHEQRRWARLATAAGFPVPSSPQGLSAAEQAAWHNAAVAPDLHRAVYIRLLDAAGLPWPTAVDALYDRHLSPHGWEPYPDAAKALMTIRSLGVRTCLLSNTGSDFREILAGAGLLGLLDDVVLSCEVGLRKPDPELFRLACARMGADPSRAVMCGDSVKDRGGEVLGIRTVIVAPLPISQRPNGFAPLVAAVGGDNSSFL